MKSIDDLSDELASYGVHEGYPTQRQDLAKELHTRGVGPADIEVLADFVMRKNPRTSPDRRAAKLAAILADSEDCARKLADVAYVRDKVATRDVFVPEADEEFDEADRAIRVAARVDSDRRRLDDVAAEFGLDPGMAAHLLNIGRELRDERRQGVSTAVVSDDDDMQERIDRWERARAHARSKRISMDQALRETQ